MPWYPRKGADEPAPEPRPEPEPVKRSRKKKEAPDEARKVQSTDVVMADEGTIELLEE